MQTQLAEAFPCKAPYLSINGIPIHPMPEESCSRLLIVDDDPKLLLFLRDELSDAGHQCSCCNNGLDALLKLRQENFDLVQLDWTLPDFSGVEMCQRLRSSGDTTSVLILTARDAVDERVQALDAGADALKIFPGDAISPSYCKALRAVLPKGTLLVVTGGVNSENLADFLAVSKGAGIGSALYSPGKAVKQIRADAVKFVHALPTGESSD